jgi:hypothetical protein
MPITHVSDEDLELYFLGRLMPEQISTIESHLTDCSVCTGRLSNVTGRFLRMLTLSSRRISNYDGIEKRREHRIPTDNPGQIQTFSPFSPTKIQVQMMDVSRNGLKVHTPVLSRGGPLSKYILRRQLY